MAWKDTLFDATFRQIPFESTALGETRSKSVVIHQSPYSNKAHLSDMGNDARRYNITAFFEGDDYEIYRDNFIIALDMHGTGELVHPLYGSMQVQVMDYSIKHEPDAVDSCSIDVNFVIAESASDNKELFVPTPLPPVEEQPTAVILDTPSETLEVYQEQLEQMSTPEAVELTRSIPEKVRAEIKKARQFLQVNTQAIYDLTSPPDWLNGIVNDTIGLMHDIPLDADPMANWRRVIHKIESIGDMFSDTDIPPLRFVGAVLPVALQSQTVMELLKLDQIQQVLTPLDIITANNVVRQNINTAITVIRRIDPLPPVSVNVPKIVLDTRTQVAKLKQASATLQQLTNEAVNKKPPLTQYTVKRNSTLRLIAHRLYADHSRADELLRLNKGLVSPAMVMAGTRLNVYAK
ncbi:MULTISPECIES: DNA circularization N-terminal domain-containing protein [unclassified Moraxella]|uniref:DNA circularization N-terminal domain-containing protein n=1 Tax=unclassified Moraxella TaxID=2685852 RepID=UPI003AF4C9DC